MPGRLRVNIIENTLICLLRDLCLLRENNIVDDDQDLTSTELTYMIDFLCTS